MILKIERDDEDNIQDNKKKSTGKYPIKRLESDPAPMPRRPIETPVKEPDKNPRIRVLNLQS